MIATVRRSLRRMARSPFPEGAPAPLLVHCCHHKVGTVWFKRVLNASGEHYGLQLIDGDQSRAVVGRSILLDDHSHIDTARLPAFRGSHMVRDPRDVVISAFFYHKRTKESWAHEPKSEYGGKSYQEHLNQFDEAEGLAVEIRRSAGTVIRDMTEWNYADPRFLELRYEEHLADEETGFTQVFEHYGFTPEAVATCVEIALGFSLNKVRTASKHIRSGQPDEWKKHFTDEHKALFKDLTGDAALKLGYETDPDW
jgi:hypothetical protein